MIIEIKDKSEILEYTWRVSQENTKNSYPKKHSKDELEQEIEAAITSDTYKVIGCYHDNILKGASIYFWIEENKYAQTTLFLIDNDFSHVANEIIDYIKKKLPGCELIIGVPFDNVNASKYFEMMNIKCIESSIDTRLKHKPNMIGEVRAQIDSLDLEAFDEYAIFHDRFAQKLEMYWTSDRVKERMNLFRIFIYREFNKIRGSIFVKKYHEGAEVFGLFIDEEFKNKGLERELLQFMLSAIYKEYEDIKEVVYFIDESETQELEVALTIGFEISDTYRCYKCVL